jgi:hypothetical protein
MKHRTILREIDLLATAQQPHSDHAAKARHILDVSQGVRAMAGASLMACAPEHLLDKLRHLRLDRELLEQLYRPLVDPILRPCAKTTLHE